MTKVVRCVIDRQKYLARQHRYNRSEKGLARNRDYWFKVGYYKRRDRELGVQRERASEQLVVLNLQLAEAEAALKNALFG